MKNSGSNNNNNKSFFFFFFWSTKAWKLKRQGNKKAGPQSTYSVGKRFSISISHVPNKTEPFVPLFVNFESSVRIKESLKGMQTFFPENARKTLLH